MRRLTDWWFRLRALVARDALEQQVDEEFAFHLEMEAEHLERGGLPPDEARREARRRFGSEVRGREQARDAWGVRLGYDLVADVRHALRQLRRCPGFTVLTVGTLGLGIGATTALFAVVHGLLVRPLPYANADRLVDFWFQYSWRGAEFDHIRGDSTVFEQVAAYSNFGEPFRPGPEAEARVLDYVPATANLFEALGTPPLLGRAFQPGEDRPGAGRVMVIGYGLWQEAFGGAPDVIGRRVTLGGAATTIIGVMPRGFYFPSPEFRAWTPLVLDPADPQYASNGYLSLVATRREGASQADVQQALDRIGARLGERFTYTTQWDKTANPTATPVRETLTGPVRRPLLLLLGAVSLLLLIACANAAALLLARTTDRTGELSVRLALGAGRGRLARQVVTESVTLAVLAAVAGATIAAGGFRTLVASLPMSPAMGDTLALGWQGFAAAFGLALTVGLGVAIVPVRRVVHGRIDHRERSEEGLRRGTHRVHGWLIAGQVTLAVMLVTGASLLIRSVDRIRQLDTGFDARDVVVMDLVSGSDSAFRASQQQFFQAVLDQVSALPGVVSAGLTNRLPIRDGGWQGGIAIEGRDDLTGANRPNSLFRSVTPGYLRTMGIAIVEGRGIEDGDREGAAPVVLVSEGFAKRMWPGESAIGKRMAVGTAAAGWRTVVGVVEETRMTSMLGEVPLTTWIPQAQFTMSPYGLVLAIRATAPPAGVLSSVRRVVTALDGRVAVSRAGTMRDVVDRALAEPLQLRFFLGLFGALALLLGSVGVYGVVSYAVARRKAELGIRMALGAAPNRIVGDVVRTGLVPVALGVGAGLAGTFALSGAMRAFLYEVSPTDLRSLAASAGVLIAMGAIAALIPGLRARRVSPVEALKSD